MKLVQGHEIVSIQVSYKTRPNGMIGMIYIQIYRSSANWSISSPVEAESCADRGSARYTTIQSGIFDHPEAKVHIWQAWRIEFSYRNIREYKGRSKGRVRDTVSRTRPFDRALYSRIFRYKNWILHNWVCAGV